ncbi:MAG: sigma-70 family RNA polymerase sigma factor [Isosphaeraceae bacterium]
MGTNQDTGKSSKVRRSGRTPPAGVGADPDGWGRLLSEHRDKLRRMVALRLDPRLRGRVDPSDVIQEAFLESVERLPEYARQSDPMPPFLWLRFLTLQRLQLVHRRQLGTKARDATREVSIHDRAFPAATSAALAARLLGRDTRASEAAIRAERRIKLQQALDRMEPIDREVLVLRHFEQLSNGECARVLGLTESASTKRYLRALERLREILAAPSGGGEEAWR